MNSIKITARTAGFLYLSYIVFQVLPDIIGSSKLVVYGDAATTAQNITASGGLFQIGFMADLLAAVLFLLTAWSLYVLLKPVNKNIALLFLLLNLGGVAIQCSSDLFMIATQLLLNDAELFKAFPIDQLQAMAMLFLNIRENGFMIAQLFYGAWLFPLGYVVYKSGMFPKIFGIVLMFHCIIWLTNFLLFFFSPEFDAIHYVSYPIGFISEFGLSLWLVIMGAKEPKPAIALNQK